MRLKQVQHTVEIDFLPDLQPVLRLCHVIEQKFQNHGAAQAAPFELEMGKAGRKIDVLNIFHADESRVLHGIGKTVAPGGGGGYAEMIPAILPQVLPADIVIAGFSVRTGEPAA